LAKSVFQVRMIAFSRNLLFNKQFIRTKLIGTSWGSYAESNELLVPLRLRVVSGPICPSRRSSMTNTTLAQAQRDLRGGYCAGGPGVLASALAWGCAALVAAFVSPRQAVIALFVGGMLIYPVGLLIEKLLGGSGKHEPGNPMAVLAMESTILMLLCLPIAYVVSLYRLDWFFPAMLLIIGGRYLLFSTMYGLRTYWLLGGVLAIAGFVSVAVMASPAAVALVGSLIEFGFAIHLTRMGRREPVA